MAAIDDILNYADGLPAESVDALLDDVAFGFSEFDIDCAAETSECSSPEIGGLSMADVSIASEAVVDTLNADPLLDLNAIFQPVEDTEATEPAIDYVSLECELLNGFDSHVALADFGDLDCEIFLNGECESHNEIDNILNNISMDKHLHLSAFSYCNWCESYGHDEFEHNLIFLIYSWVPYLGCYCSGITLIN